MTESSKITNYMKNDLFRPHFQLQRKKPEPFSGSSFNRQISGSDRTQVKVAPKYLKHINDKSFAKDTAGFSNLKSYPMKGDLFKAGIRNKVKSLPINKNRINVEQISAQQEIQENITSVNDRDALLFIPSILAKLQIAQSKGVDPVYSEAEILYLKKLNIISDVELIAYIDALPQNIKQNLVALLPAGGIIPAPPAQPIGPPIPPPAPPIGPIQPVLPIGGPPAPPPAPPIGPIQPVLPIGGPPAPPIKPVPVKKPVDDLDEVFKNGDPAIYMLYARALWVKTIKASSFIGINHVKEFSQSKHFKDAISVSVQNSLTKQGSPVKFSIDKSKIIANQITSKPSTLENAWKNMVNANKDYKLDVKKLILYI
jgi:hypothetical protein